MRTLDFGVGLVLALLLTNLGTAQEAGLHKRHVVFETSQTEESYYFSASSVVAPSDLEIANDKCPVESKYFTSPPNSLRLRWKSVTGGDWRVSINVATRYGRQFEFIGDTLSMWCYSVDGLSASDSPRIGLRDSRGRGLPDISLIADGHELPAGKWIEVRLPLSSFLGNFKGTSDFDFDSRKLTSLRIAQNLDDGNAHTLFVDDIRLINNRDGVSDPLEAPTGLRAAGYDRHIDLAWQKHPSDTVCSYRIYRSEDDGKTFAPHATRPGYCQRYCDYLGQSGKSCKYKISAVDLYNKESQQSDSVNAQTKAMGDDELLSMVQEACFRFYWDAANPESGMAIEIWPGDQNLAAVGASGFGIMALIVGAEREFVSREEAAERMLKIVRFLRDADRFHGVWSHFIEGKTGKALPYFGKYDNGGDLVETAFIVQGLLAARQYFDSDSEAEREIRDTITTLWQEVEWDWYRKTPDGEVLYWHWSPDHAWHISHPLIGWNETMIVYLLAIASPTHPVPASLYHTGWAGTSDQAVEYRRNWSRTTQGDHYANGHKYYGHQLDVGCGTGGDLFFAQFSTLGFDPRGRRDRFTNYFENNRNLALINRAYCMENPRGYKGYGANCWGLSAGVNNGGGKPDPRNDNGTICSSAALGCFPYVPEEAMATLKHYYRKLGGKVWGVYGFHDGFNQSQNWFEEVYMGLNQAQIVVGIENYRSGLIWQQFMANPEIEPMLEAIGFQREE